MDRYNTAGLSKNVRVVKGCDADPQADQIEGAAHIGLAVSPDVFKILASKFAAEK